ncbi:MAG: laccase [Gemmatimonadetes bacterium]|nr:laccase [Gemmatimonadota bacterium]NIO30720.1 laccase [Gemmatimonadota bacterium]
MTSSNEVETRLGKLRVFKDTGLAARFPELAQGITGRVLELDFGTAEQNPADRDRGPSEGWALLRAFSGIDRVARCRQVHGAEVITCERLHRSGVAVLGQGDAIVTDQAGVLLTVTVADCVPVFMVDPQQRLLGLAHAGWRGTAAGVVGATLEAMRRLGANAESLYVHLGPAICGGCYEVGSEVQAALGGSREARRVDLRAHIARGLAEVGVDGERLTASAACTRCDSGSFFSHRGGDRGRRMCAFLGWPAG